MPTPRRSVPDSLDPLVDTLSNVVGILVVVVALAQIQVGDVAARLGQRERSAGVSEEVREESPAVPVDPDPDRPALAARRSRLLARGGDDLADSDATAAALLETVEALPEDEASDESVAGLRRRRAATRAEVAALRDTLEGRVERAEALRRVPAELVARLPDPQVLRGEPLWILVRHGRVVPVERAVLFERGADAIERLLPDGGARRVEPREFEMVASYLRKRPVGVGDLRWLLEPTPQPVVRLAWRSPDAGLDATALGRSDALATWLSAYDPERHFVQFHVWSDSFEVYLDARRIVEAEGFRAGWEAYRAEEEIRRPLAFGPTPSREREIEVD